MVEVLGVRWVHALCPKVIARSLELAAGGGVGARTEALDGGRGGTFWYWNGMLPAVRVKRGSARYLFHVTRMPRGWMRLVRRPGDDVLRAGADGAAGRWGGVGGKAHSEYDKRLTQLAPTHPAHPAGQARAGHATLTSFLAAAAAVFVADVVGRGGKGLETRRSSFKSSSAYTMSDSSVRHGTRLLRAFSACLRRWHKLCLRDMDDIPGRIRSSVLNRSLLP